MKGQVSGLMKLILIAVSLIILIMVGWKLKDFAQEATQEGSCAWSFVAARFTSGDVPEGCKRKIIEIDDEALAKYKVEAQKAIAGYTASSNSDLFNFYSGIGSSNGVLHWSISALVSDELVSCVKKSRGSSKAFQNYVDGGNIVCVLCSEFVFSDKIKLELGDSAVSIQDSFLKNRFYEDGRDFVSALQVIMSSTSEKNEFLLPTEHSALVFGSVVPSSAAEAIKETKTWSGLFLRPTKNSLNLGESDKTRCRVVIG